MRLPINHFSIIVRPPPCTARCVLSCADSTCFTSDSVTVDQRFNAASEKENNTEGISLSPPTPLPHPPLGHNTDEKN